MVALSLLTTFVHYRLAGDSAPGLFIDVRSDNHPITPVTPLPLAKQLAGVHHHAESSTASAHGLPHGDRGPRCNTENAGHAALPPGTPCVSGRSPSNKARVTGVRDAPCPAGPPRLCSVSCYFRKKKHQDLLMFSDDLLTYYIQLKI